MNVDTRIGPPLSPDEVFLVSESLKGRAQPQWNLYFSRVRFTTTVSTTPFVYTIASGTSLVAFGYGQGGSATVAGFTTATNSDTSLQNANQTINSEYVLVRGISLFLSPASDPILAKQLDPVCNVTAKLGPVNYQLGCPTFQPGWGGFTGMTEAISANPNLYEQFAKCIGGLSNGIAMAGNTFKFPRSLVWMPPGAGSSSPFSVVLATTAAASTPANISSADRAAGAAGATYNGAPAAWTHPAATAIFVDYFVVLDHVPFYIGG